jgi:hypothetical protein
MVANLGANLIVGLHGASDRKDGVRGEWTQKIATPPHARTRETSSVRIEPPDHRDRRRAARNLELRRTLKLGGQLVARA